MAAGALMRRDSAVDARARPASMTCETSRQRAAFRIRMQCARLLVSKTKTKSQKQAQLHRHQPGRRTHITSLSLTLPSAALTIAPTYVGLRQAQAHALVEGGQVGFPYFIA